MSASNTIWIIDSRIAWLDTARPRKSFQTWLLCLGALTRCRCCICFTCASMVKKHTEKCFSRYTFYTSKKVSQYTPMTKQLKMKEHNWSLIYVRSMASHSLWCPWKPYTHWSHNSSLMELQMILTVKSIKSFTLVYQLIKLLLALGPTMLENYSQQSNLNSRRI